MSGTFEEAGPDKRSKAFAKLWEDTLPQGPARDKLDQFGHTVALGDGDIEWLENKLEQNLPPSGDPHELEHAAKLLSDAYIPLSGRGLAVLQKTVDNKDVYPLARVQAGVALWTKGINRDAVRPLLNEAYDGTLLGTKDEIALMKAIAEDLLSEEKVNPNK